MPIKLEESEINELKKAFSYQLNYESDDPHDPIDPLTYRNPEGDSCLHIAAQKGDYRSVELLLKAGLNVNELGDMGYTPLHYAKKWGHENVAKLLISHGASLSIRDEFGKLPSDL